MTACFTGQKVTLRRWVKSPNRRVINDVRNTSRPYSCDTDGRIVNSPHFVIPANIVVGGRLVFMARAINA